MIPRSSPTAPAARPSEAPSAARPRVIVRRTLTRDDRVAAAAAGVAVALGAGLATFYLTTLWRARDPR